MKISEISLYQKTNWKWNEAIPGAEGTLKLVLRKGGDNPHIFEANGEAADYEFDISQDKTDIPQGYYNFQYIIDNDIVTSGKLIIKPNLLSSHDPRNQDEINLDELEASYKRLCSRDVDEVTIRGRSFKYRDREKLRIEIKLLKIKLGKIQPKRILESYE